MVTIRRERKADVAPREALLDVSYGPIRFSKTSERLREGRRPGLSFVAASGRRLVGTVRLWDVSAGPGRPALLLGPLTVAPDCRNKLAIRTDGDHILCNVRRATERVLALAYTNDRHRCLWRYALDVAGEIDIQHRIADHEDPLSLHSVE